MKTIVLLIASALSISAQTTVNLPTLTVSAEATAALNATLTKTFVDGAQPISLTAPVGIGDTTINVVATAGVGATSAITIDNEAMKITAKTATTFTVVRGHYATTAAVHPVTAQANELKYPTMMRAFLQAVADFVGTQMDQANSATVATQNALITAANAAKQAAKAGAIQ